MHTCPKCLYTSLRAYNLTRHIEMKHTEDEKLENTPIPLHVCKFCHETFSHQPSRSRHERKCAEKHKPVVLIAPVPPTPPPQQTKLLTYPPTGIDNRHFDFLRDHITTADMKRIFEKSPVELGFRRYIYSIFDRPENRIVHKTHPNNNYSKVHIGQGQWSIELDDDVYKVITHFLTCAALQSTQDHTKFMKTVDSKIRLYLDDVNTQNDENDNYLKATQRIKLIIVNLTTKWKEEGLI